MYVYNCMLFLILLTNYVNIASYVDAEGNKKIMGSTQFEALDARR